MILMLPLPGYIASRMQEIIKAKMEKVRISNLVEISSQFLFSKTDARVESVTQSMSSYALMCVVDLRTLNKLIYSHRCSSYGQTFWMGTKHASKTERSSRRRAEMAFQRQGSKICSF